MKKLLLITYFFPPSNNVGAIRAKGIAKYLPSFGWDVFILTPLTFSERDNKYKVIETYPPFREKLGYFKRKLFIDYNKIVYKPPFYKSFFSIFNEILPIPDTKKGWILYGVYSGREIIKKENISAIISVYSPATCHVIGYKLKREFPHIKWIADFRDLWLFNPFSSYNKLNKFFIRKIERKILAISDFLTTVSEPFAKQLKDSYNKESFPIPNGFDPEEFNFKCSIDNKFSITYTGSLYSGERNPERLFLVIKKMVCEDKKMKENLEINFYSKYEPFIEKLIKKYGLEEVVKQKGIIPREEVIKKQKSSQILLLLNRNFIEDKGVYTGKLFEYLGARRPILAIGHKESVVKDLIKETNAGVYCWEEQHLYHTLKDWYKEWKLKKIVEYKGIEDKVNLYSHKSMAEKFAFVLEK